MKKFVLILITFYLIILCNCGGSSEIALVKTGQFKVCPGKTIEEVVNGFMESITWTSKENDFGTLFVNVSGKHKELKNNLVLQFVIDKTNSTFNINAIQLNNGELIKDKELIDGMIESACSSSNSKDENRNYSDNDRYKNTMLDMKTIGTAVESYMTDNYIAPTELDGTGFGGENIRSFHIKRFPPTDAWGNIWHYSRDPHERDIYSIGSAGRDGVWKGFDQSGYNTNFSGDDIIYSNGAFVYGPKKTQVRSSRKNQNLIVDDFSKSVIRDFLNTFDVYIEDMNKSENVDDAIAAMEKFAKVMKMLKPEMEEIEKKYPFLKNAFKGNDVPDEFKEFERRIKGMASKMTGIMGKMMQYMNDPKFQEASKKFSESMK